MASSPGSAHYRKKTRRNMCEDTRDVHLSKNLSWLLRHGADKYGLHLEYGGYVDVEKILALPSFQQYSLQEVQRVVETNEKKRFSLKTSLETGKLQIRANQGHSLPVDERGLLTRLTKIEEFPENVVHGTYTRHWQQIKEQGMSRMKRNHIHFAVGLPGDQKVLSGMRPDCDVFVIIDTRKALADGIPFYRSENNVILSPGDEHGVIKPEYFKQVLQKSLA